MRDAARYLCRFMHRDSAFLKFKASGMAAAAILAAMNAQSALFRHKAALAEEESKDSKPESDTRAFEDDVTSTETKR